MEIFKLFGRILIENDPANRALQETDERAAKVGTTLANGIRTAARWGAGIAAAAGAAGGALLALANRTAQASDKLVVNAQRAGTTTTAYQEMRYALTQVGVAESDVSMALQRLNQRVGDADTGTGKYAEALRRLGVTTRNVDGEIKSSDQTFMELITRLHEVEDAQTRASLAGDIFGVNLAQRILPAIEAGGDALADLRNRAHDIGAVLGKDGVQAGSSFASMMDELRLVVASVSQQIMVRFMPTLSRWLEWTTEHVPKVGAVFEFVFEVVEIIFRYMRLIIGDAIAWMRENAIEPFVNWLARVWEERGPPIVAAVEALWDGVKAVFGAVFDVLRGLWDAFILAFQGDWEAAWARFKETATNLWNALPELFTGIINPLIDIADNIMTAVIDVIRAVFGDDVGDIFQAAWDAIVVAFEAGRDIVLGLWTALTAAFRGDWEGAWNAIQGVIETAWDAIETVVETGLGIIRTTIDAALNGIVALIRWAFGDEAAEAVDNLFDAVRLIVDTGSETIMGIIRAFSALFRGDWEAAWQEIRDVAIGIWNALPEIFEQSLDGIVGIADSIMQAVIGVIRQLFGNEIADSMSGIWDTILDVLDVFRDTFLGVWRALTAAFSGDWSAAWDEVVGVVTRVWTAIPGVVEGALNNVFGIVDTILTSIIGLIERLFGERVASVFQRAWDAVTIVFETARDTLLGILDVLSSLFAGDWEEAWEGVLDILTRIWDGVLGIIAGPLDGVVDWVSSWVLTIHGLFTAMRDTVTAAVRNTAEGIVEWFSETKLGQTFSWIGEQVRGVTGWFYDMYDKVVGNSYVPDMVEEIGEAIQRLKDRLANPVARYTADVIASFSDMEDEVIASMMSMAEAMDKVLDGMVSRVTRAIGDITREFWNGTATWANVLHMFAGAIGDIFGSIFDAIAKELVRNIIMQNEWLVSTLANIATAITGFLSQAYATLVAFFAWSGPAAPLLAGGVIAAAIAGIASLAGSAIRGMLPDAPSPGGGTGYVGGDRGPASSGRQVSEITGPTRDLLTDLLSPLASLNTLTGVGERIYGLLDERLPVPVPGVAMAGPNGVTVNVAPGAVQIHGRPEAASDIDVDELAERLAQKIAFDLRGTGR